MTANSGGGKSHSASSSSTATMTSSPFLYGAVGLSLVMALALKPFGSGMAVIWAAIVSADLGNAIAAFVAVGGYMLEHFNQRKSQQMEAQINRVSDQSHNFLVPVTLQYHSIMTGSCLHFIDKHLDLVLEKIDDEEIIDQCIGKSVRQALLKTGNFTIPTNLKHQSSFTLLVRDVMMTSKQNDKIDKDHPETSKLGFAPSIVQSRELPKVVHDAVYNARPWQSSSSKTPPVSPLWKSYERFVRNEFVPGVDRIAELIDEHGDLMEPVPPSRLEEIFGRPDNGYGQKWSTMPRMWFYSMWLAYARGWKTVLDAWEDGDYTLTRPNVDMPTGIMFFNIEGQTIVSKAEKELVGMSQMHYRKSGLHGFEVF
mmetsp:Transcript_34537/g.83367  ORF Transcript_34537/g.83367 Transcript_34537/m.83367 type:complete len:368 (+) Transcript_34537:238-1341(+)